MYWISGLVCVLELLVLAAIMLVVAGAAVLEFTPDSYPTERLRRLIRELFPAHRLLRTRPFPRHRSV